MGKQVIMFLWVKLRGVRDSSIGEDHFQNRGQLEGSNSALPNSLEAGVASTVDRTSRTQHS
jgi:hypothetical protein